MQEALYNSTNDLLLRTLSYEAVVDAFAYVVVGNLSVASEAGIKPSTTILQTKLAYGPELHGLSGDRPLLYPNLTLQVGIEELWLNLTLSLFSAEAAAVL